MASWNEIWGFSALPNPPPWLTMNVGTSCPQVGLHPGGPSESYRSGCSSGGNAEDDSRYNAMYRVGYNAGYHAGYHHSENQPDHPRHPPGDMASWRHVYRCGRTDELPQWMRMDVETSSPQVGLRPGRPSGFHNSGWSFGDNAEDDTEYNAGYDSGYHVAYHHSENQLERPTGHQSNYCICWAPPRCEMVLNVPIFCDDCHDLAVDGVSEIEGVREVNVDRTKRELTVKGTFAINEILTACKKIFKRSKWQPT